MDQRRIALHPQTIEIFGVDFNANKNHLPTPYAVHETLSTSLHCTLSDAIAFSSITMLKYNIINTREIFWFHFIVHPGWRMLLLRVSHNTEPRVECYAFSVSKLTLV